MNVMAAICNLFSGRHSFASLTRLPGLNERAPVEEAAIWIITVRESRYMIVQLGNHLA